MEVLQGVQHCVVSITRAHNYGRYCRHVVYFDRNVKSMFYVDYKPASQEIIWYKREHENSIGRL
jgi:hypothetical protein